MKDRFKILVRILFGVFLVAFLSSAFAGVYTPSQRRRDMVMYRGPMDMTMRMDQHWQLHLTYMWMTMSGLLDGDSRVSTDDVFSQGFLNASRRMSTQMWMMGAMYMTNMHYSFMLMLPYQYKVMNNVRRNGEAFVEKTNGIGDIIGKFHLALIQTKKETWHVILGMTAPTGSISESPFTSPADIVHFSYPMQLGSGTFDFLWGTAYTIAFQPCLLGLTVNGIVRMGKNRFQYALGNELYIATWLQRDLGDSVFAQLRLDGRSVGRIRGQDPHINPRKLPAADPKLQGGRYVDLSAAVVMHNMHGHLKNQALRIEVGHPLYENLNGPQLEASWYGLFIWSINL